MFRENVLEQTYSLSITKKTATIGILIINGIVKIIHFLKIVFYNHSECEFFYLNNSCTVKVDLIQFVDLPFSRSFAKQTQ
ncbi:unnamed protein product [Paramecium pentaurelia]|uniref:Uncharacterized protein n=1 Tax=Paramecium pentaurelia TaxID=43138 RepID=A0A8S1UM08_9CILI|nr:unnamed protein product [Paramecium pentaurelia]